MTEEKATRLRVKLGAAEIEYEGDTQFLKDTIMPTVEKILEMIETRTELQRPMLQLDARSKLEYAHPSNEALSNTSSVSGGTASKPIGSLSSYIISKGGDINQVLRFLATAAWLSRRGRSDLSPSLIAKTLQENQQKKLANPADCLNKNVGKGHCEKTKEGFLITPEGWAALGESQ